MEHLSETNKVWVCLTALSVNLNELKRFGEPKFTQNKLVFCTHAPQTNQHASFAVTCNRKTLEWMEIIHLALICIDHNLCEVSLVCPHHRCFTSDHVMTGAILRPVSVDMSLSASKTKMGTPTTRKQRTRRTFPEMQGRQRCAGVAVTSTNAWIQDTYCKVCQAL